MQARLRDTFGRRFQYLRLSVTDACNFRCEYCLPDGYQPPADGLPRPGPRGFLTEAEIRRLLAAFGELGIRKLRLTGGEPLLRRDLPALVAAAATTPGIEQVALTTNGYRLAAALDSLVAAGLSAVNISLDSLDADNFESITGDRRHRQVLDAIDAALDADLASVKVNTVLLRGLNDAEVPDFIDFVRHRPLSVRFIELMQTADNGSYFLKRHVRGVDVARQLTAAGWQRQERGTTDGPAVVFRHRNYAGSIGLITPYAAGFCDGCNRLRVTARGALRLCLFGSGSFDLRPWLQQDGERAALQRQVCAALLHKDISHHLDEGDYGDTPHLAMTGG